MDTCVVTGGAGFIGSHLCEALLSRGHPVICIDNFLTGLKKNIEALLSDRRFRFVEHDVVQPLTGIDTAHYIFHLASPASVIDYQRYPEETALANGFGTRTLLQLAKKKKAKFLFASTSEVYGDPLEHPQKETYWGNVNPVGLRACYDESKRFGEMMTMLYCKHYDVDARIIRIFNTYGPRMRPNDGRVISNFIHQALDGKPITVYGDGTQTRSFCYVSDLVDGMMRAMFQLHTNGEVINLGNPEEYQVMEIAQKVKAMTRSGSPISLSPLPEDDPARRKPDISKAKKLLSWEPVVPLVSGLEKTIQFYRSGEKNA